MEDNKRLGEILFESFGFETFRPVQEELVRAAINGRDLLAILPTGKVIIIPVCNEEIIGRYYSKRNFIFYWKRLLEEIFYFNFLTFL